MFSIEEVKELIKKVATLSIELINELENDDFSVERCSNMVKDNDFLKLYPEELVTTEHDFISKDDVEYFIWYICFTFLGCCLTNPIEYENERLKFITDIDNILDSDPDAKKIILTHAFDSIILTPTFSIARAILFDKEIDNIINNNVGEPSMLHQIQQHMYDNVISKLRHKQLFLEILGIDNMSADNIDNIFTAMNNKAQTSKYCCKCYAVEFSAISIGGGGITKVKTMIPEDIFNMIEARGLTNNLENIESFDNNVYCDRTFKLYEHEVIGSYDLVNFKKIDEQLFDILVYSNPDFQDLNIDLCDINNVEDFEKMAILFPLQL